MVLLTAIGAIILTWLVLFAAFAGVGLLAARGSHDAERDDDLGTSFWTGWAIVLALLQAWSLLLPVDGRARLTVGGLALAGWLLALGTRRIPRVRPDPWVWGALALAALWCADRALAPPLNNDSSYHLMAVRWAAEHPVVPGLGHLHFRLAFHSAYFLYAALLEAGTWAGRSHHVASGLPLLVLLGAGIAGVRRVITDGAAAPPVCVFDGLLLPVLVKQALGPDVSSASSDAGAFVMGIVVCRALVCLLQSMRVGAAPAREVVRVAFFAAIAVAVKLSVLGIAAGAVVAAVALSRARARHLLLAAAVALAVLVPCAARGVVLSGYPAFPLPVWGVPVEWRLPAAQVEEQAEWVRSWARAPGLPISATHGVAWLGPWSRRVARHRVDILLPIAVAACLVALVARRGMTATGWLLLPPVAGIVFWLLTAPDPRFAGASFWLLAAAAVLVAVARLRWSPRAMAATAALLAGMVVLAHAWRADLLVRPGPGGGLHPLPEPVLRPFRTDAGLVLPVPADGECWNAPLPCTPTPDRRLRLRNPEDLGAGFVLGP